MHRYSHATAAAERPTAGRCPVAAIVLAFCAGAAPAGAQDLALRGATVHTAAGPAIPNATVLVRDGLIAAVGPEVSIPAGIEVIDVTGKTIIPGLMDNHSHIGFAIGDVNERGTAFAPRYRITDVLSPDDRYWNAAIAGGVTTVVTGPGSGSVSSGQAAVVKTWGDDWDARILDATGGLKIAMGGKNPQTGPGTSMATTSLIREQFTKAREYVAAWDRWEAGRQEGPPPTRDLDMEVLARILRGEERVRAHVHSAHDILSIIRLSQEFDFALTIHHATEAYKVADAILESGTSVVGLPLFIRVGLEEDVMRSPATLSAMGILFAFHTDDPVVHSKYQRYNAAMAMRYGMPEEEALKAASLNGATIAGVADRVGSIETGKDADLVVIDGPWYELTSRIERVYVNGRLAYDAAAPTEAGR